MASATRTQRGLERRALFGFTMENEFINETIVMQDADAWLIISFRNQIRICWLGDGKERVPPIKLTPAVTGWGMPVDIRRSPGRSENV